MDGILTSPLKTPNPFNHQLHGRKPFDTHLNDARTGTEFFQKFGDSAVYAMSFDPRIKSNRGWVEKSLYASDFSADADGWTDAGTLTGNNDGVDGKNDVLKNVTGSSVEMVTNQILSVGATYKVTFALRYDSANSQLGVNSSLDLINGSQRLSLEAAEVTDTWTDLTVTFKATDTDLALGKKAFIGSPIAIPSGEIIYVHNFTLSQVIKDPVVHLLRDSDSTYRSFTAPEVASGVMTNWVTDGDPTANGHIHTAYDPSGNGNDATQTTVANMPKLVDAGTLVTDANGNVALKFDGVDDWLDNGGLSASSGMAIFAIVETNDTAASKFIVGSSESSNAIWRDVSEAINFTAGGFTNVTQSLRPVAVSASNSLLTFLRYGTNLAVYQNGSVSASSSTYSAASTVMPRYIGAYNAGLGPHDGTITALFIYNADMSSQRPAIEAALAQIYGVTLS